MRDISRFIFSLIFLFLFSSCAIFNSGSKENHFIVDQARLVEFTKEILRDNNLYIYTELEEEDGSYEITAFLPQEDNDYPDEVTAINSIRVILSPEEEGFFVSVQQPPKHERHRRASHIDYEERLLDALHEMLDPEELELIK